VAREKFVVRLLDPNNEMLGWATVYGEPRPNERRRSCCFFPGGPTYIKIERGGRAERMSIHWCDLDIGRITNIIDPQDVTAGQSVVYHWIEPLFQVVGSAEFAEQELACTVIRDNVTIDIPAGALGVIGH
jgi:hypothetical protein